MTKAHGKFAVIKVEFETINIISKWLTYTIPAKNKDGFYSMPGLFSYKTIDPASQFLTSTFNNQLEGHVIDLGAGWGVLSSELLKKSTNIKSITLMDHDLRAIACAKKNISNPKAKFKWMDINEINNFKFKFDYAISNPPFHSNKGRNIDLGKSFIIAAHKVLKPRGHFFLVANIQLPYENIIDSLFDSFKIQSQNKYFKIILAKKPKRHYDISDVTI